ncbi:MAG: hypothetical protein IJH65_13560 [Methanobrevibacter sp.]|nr:hypothetical protein [Methanobrevibacter sp.]
MSKKIDEIETVKVPKSRITKLAQAVEHLEDDAPVSIEYVLMALFPSVWENMQQSLKNAYTKGYLEGLKENEH